MRLEQSQQRMESQQSGCEPVKEGVVDGDYIVLMTSSSSHSLDTSLELYWFRSFSCLATISPTNLLYVIPN